MYNCITACVRYIINYLVYIVVIIPLYTDTIHIEYNYTV